MAFTFYYGFEDFVYFYDSVFVVQLIIIESICKVAFICCVHVKKVFVWRTCAVFSVFAK